MTVRETELSILDEHCVIIDQLATKLDQDWQDKAQSVLKMLFSIELRWREGNEIVTNLSFKKEGNIWRTIISRVQIADTPNLKI